MDYASSSPDIFMDFDPQVYREDYDYDKNGHKHFFKF